LKLYPGSNLTRPGALEESMGREGFEMVFGLAGGLPLTERRLAAYGEAAAVGGAVPRRLFVRLGEPRPAPLSEVCEVEVPVTLGVPLASLALAPVGSGFVAGSPLTIRWVDDQGSSTHLPDSHLTLVLRTLPGAATFARFQTVVRVPGAGRALRFSVLHAGSGLATSGEAAYAPPRVLAETLAPRFVTH
jgi:hypothetical protein